MTCKGIVPSDQPHLVYTVTRADGSVARELSVCAMCHDVLRAGAALRSTNTGPTIIDTNEPTGDDQCQS